MTSCTTGLSKLQDSGMPEVALIGIMHCRQKRVLNASCNQIHDIPNFTTFEMCTTECIWLCITVLKHRRCSRCTVCFPLWFHFLHYACSAYQPYMAASIAPCKQFYFFNVSTRYVHELWVLMSAACTLEPNQHKPFMVDNDSIQVTL